MTEQKKKREEIYTFWFYVSDTPEILGCQQEERQTAAMVRRNGVPKWSPESANPKKHYQRNTVGEVHLGTLESLHIHINI